MGLASQVVLMVRNPPAMQETTGGDAGVGNIPWRREWQPTPVFLPGKSHGQRSLVGYSLRGHKELDMTERLNFHFQSVNNLPVVQETLV